MFTGACYDCCYNGSTDTLLQQNLGSACITCPLLLHGFAFSCSGQQARRAENQGSSMSCTWLRKERGTWRWTNATASSIKNIADLRSMGHATIVVTCQLSFLRILPYYHYLDWLTAGHHLNKHLAECLHYRFVAAFEVSWCLLLSCLFPPRAVAVGCHAGSRICNTWVQKVINL